ncbi:head-tail connector protein [Hwanghaeella sp.]|uniref:head-tail connector protein n=1 Tax=Hwanghaeella sp. TaxID=2605943 RepID=UPI003CCBF9D4
MLRLVTAPAAEPVSLEEAKEWLYVEHSDDDALISSLIRSARQEVERMTRRKLISQTLAQVLPCFPCGEIILEAAPVDAASVVVTYLDADGAEQTLNAPRVFERNGVTRVWPNVNDGWPETLEGADAVTVEFTAGWSDVAALEADAEPLIRAVKTIVAQDYDERGRTGNRGIDNLVGAFTISRFV